MSYAVRRRAWREERNVRGLKHRLTWWGDRSETPVVLLHGWMDTGETWQFVVDCLPDSWTCVAPDWRGFGGTERAPGGYWFPDYYADLEALLDQLVPHEPARVVGHSMGGNIAAMYAGIRTRRLEWLVNLEGLGLRRTAPEQAPRRYEQWLDQLKEPSRPRAYSSLDELARVLQGRNPRLDEDKARFIAGAWSRPAAEGIELAADPAHRMVNPTLYRREESEAVWRRIDVPMLLLLGELSEHREILGADYAENYLRSVYRKLRMLTIPGVGHMMHHEDPQAVAHHIVEFARLVESGAAGGDEASAAPEDQAAARSAKQ